MCSAAADTPGPEAPPAAPQSSAGVPQISLRQDATPDAGNEQERSRTASMGEPEPATAQQPCSQQLGCIFGEATMGELAGGLRCIRSANTLSRLQLPDDLLAELPSLSHIELPALRMQAAPVPPLPQPPLDSLQVSSAGACEPFRCLYRAPACSLTPVGNQGACAFLAFDAEQRLPVAD